MPQNAIFVATIQTKMFVSFFPQPAHAECVPTKVVEKYVSLRPGVEHTNESTVQKNNSGSVVQDHPCIITTLLSLGSLCSRVAEPIKKTLVFVFFFGRLTQVDV